MNRAGEYFHYGQFGANSLGGIVRRDWPGIFYLWEKATGGGAINQWNRAMCLSIFCFKCIPAGDCGMCFNGDTVLHKTVSRHDDQSVSSHCHVVDNTSGMIVV